MIAINKLAEELDLHPSTIKYHIKKNNLTKYREKGEICIKASDADIVRSKKKNEYHDWVAIITIANETGTGNHKVGNLARAKGMVVKKSVMNHKSGAYVLGVSPKDAEKLRDALAPRRTAKAQSSKTAPPDFVENRAKGYYTRITPVWMMQTQQG